MRAAAGLQAGNYVFCLYVKFVVLVYVLEAKEAKTVATIERLLHGFRIISRCNPELKKTFSTEAVKGDT